MHRIDHATALPGNLFTEGNPATATPATTVTDDWLNDVQGNICDVIETAGIELDKGEFTQLTLAIQALILDAFGAYTTPPLFDSTTKPATTEFVRRSGLQKSGIVSVAGATNITASHIGGTISCSGAGGYTLTLPGAAAVAQGATVTIINSGTGPITVQRGGADLIYMGSATPTSITVAAGDTVVLEAWTSIWIASSGAALLPFSGNFASSPYHQVLPSGLIIQWGGTTAATSGTITFPVAWPNGMLSIAVANQITTGTPTDSPVFRAQTLTNIAWVRSSATAFLWIAIGR